MSKSTGFALQLWPFILGVLIVLGLNRAEHAFFPVVSDFAVVQILRNGDQVLAQGYMRKIRDCKFVGVSATGISGDSEISVRLNFRDSNGDDSATRPTGTQAWGPWQLTMPAAPELSEVRLQTVHICHPFWSTNTDLISIPVSKRML